MSIRFMHAVILVAFPAGLFGSGMTFPGRVWEETPPDAAGFDAAKLASAVGYLERNAPRDGVRELLIERNGRVVFAGPDVAKVHGVWSCTKSFTSTVLGLLIDDGKCTLETLMKKYVPSAAKMYPEVTLRRFTTMTSGYRAAGDEPQGSYTHGPSRTPFVPGPPLFTPPGSKYAYWDSAMNQFANVLTRIAGEPLKQVFARRIAGEIGMSSEEWDWGDFGEVDGIVVNGGSGNNNKHVLISARQMARLGHLFLNAGAWNGKRLISDAWVRSATRTQVAASTPLAHPESGIAGPGTYGYNWWTNGVKPDGKRKWPGVPESTYAASGHNNNDMFVIPPWGVVVVRLGLDQSGGRGFEITDQTYAEFLRKLGAAIVRHE